MEHPKTLAAGAPGVVGNLIAGHSQPAHEGRVVEVKSPRTGALLGSVPDSDIDDVAAAVEHAATAADDWSSRPIRERTAPLHRFRERLLGELDPLAELISLESGKTADEGRAELLKGVEVIDYALSLQNLKRGGAMEVSRGVTCESHARPLGVVAGVTPFNFPAMVPLWMFPIAVTLGNAFVLKPADRTPLAAARLGDLMNAAGYPAGVFSVVHGGPVAVQALLDHPQIAAVGFVGSTRVARQVYERATQHGKRTLCLGGAKNPLILMPDADPDVAVAGIVASFTGCAGQRCMAGSVLLAVGDCDALIAQIIEAARGIRLGEHMGAIIDAKSLARLHAAIEEESRSGQVQLALDGRGCTPPIGCESGYWLGPTILDHAQTDSRCVREELFGPVLTILRVDNLDAAIAFERANPYGNAVSIFTRSAAAAEQLRVHATSGMVGINVGVPVPREPFSFGGTKQSRFGQGDITGAGGVALWSNMQKITSKWTQTDGGWMS